MLKSFIILSIFSLKITLFGRELKDFDSFWKVLIQVESGGKTNAIGDNGRAIGVAQIHKIYWTDAIKYDKSIGGKYEDCFNVSYSKKIVYAYLSKYSKSNNFEEWAKLHNGGCNWNKKTGQVKKNLDLYWAKFSVILLNERNRINTRI